MNEPQVLTPATETAPKPTPAAKPMQAKKAAAPRAVTKTATKFKAPNAAKATPASKKAPAAKAVVAASQVKAPKATKATKATKTSKVPAAPKAKAVEVGEKGRQKMVRDSFTMPRGDYELIAELKQRTMLKKRVAKKSELLRAGLQALAALSDAQLLKRLDALTPVKAGRPKGG